MRGCEIVCMWGGGGVHVCGCRGGGGVEWDVMHD